MSLAAVFDKLGQTVLPNITGKVFPDLMSITGETVTQGTGGGMIKSAAVAAYENVPVSYKPTNSGSRQTRQSKQISLGEYELTFATHLDGTRIDFDIKAHRFTVSARGNEPAKVFRPMELQDVSGVVFKVVCEREN